MIGGIVIITHSIKLYLTCSRSINKRRKISTPAFMDGKKNFIEKQMISFAFQLNDF